MTHLTNEQNEEAFARIRVHCANKKYFYAASAFKNCLTELKMFPNHHKCTLHTKIISHTIMGDNLSFAISGWRYMGKVSYHAGKTRLYDSRPTFFVCGFFWSLEVHADQINGLAFGIFVNPQPPSPPSVTTGIGTNNITFGIPCDGVTNCGTSPGGITPPNRVFYDPLPFATEIGQPFVFGTVLFFNGTIQSGTEISRITLSTDTFGNNLPGTKSSRIIDIINTPNTGDPVASADFLSIGGGPNPIGSSFHVLESGSATATLVGRFKDVIVTLLSSSIVEVQLELEILGFGNVISGDGFITNPIVTNPISISKEITSGPDNDDDGEIDLVVEANRTTLVNILSPDGNTPYDFTITYVPEDSTDVVVADTVPAEWKVVSINNDADGNPLDLPLGCGELTSFDVPEDTVVSRGGKLGKKCRSATHIEWTPDPVQASMLNVGVQVNQSASGKDRFAPSSCGALLLNDGATAFEIEPVTGEFVLIEGERVIVAGPTPSLCLAAVRDLSDGFIDPNPDGIILRDGSGDEDLDGLTDLMEACDIGTNPCLADTDEDTFNDDLDNCPIDLNPNQTDDDLDGVGNVCDMCLNTSLQGNPGADGCALGDAVNGPGLDLRVIADFISGDDSGLSHDFQGL